MMRVIAIAVVVTVALLDVMPCGHPREPMTAQAGDACGGPFVCASPSTCVTLDQSITMPNYQSSYVCTKSCASDADCSGMNMAMTCSGMGRTRGYEKPSERVCIPIIAKDAGI